MSSPNFVDYVKICCRSGQGGAGSKHFYRDRTTAKGGPDGGDGAKGGSIIAVGDRNTWTLLHLKYHKHVIAMPGGAGGANNRTGAEAEDIYLKVPLGTVVKDPETGEQLHEIVEDGETFVLAKGGRGGKGNTHFKSSTHQAPKFSQPGEEGEENWRILELKVLADVGLVGFPNAGKSTLLSVVSAAKPEIADYPFTTLVPNLGIVAYRDEKSFIMADIPGIIEGASEGKGLGLRFLRHIERNSVLLFMVPADSNDIKQAYEILLNELGSYNPELLHKQRLLAITKSDLIDDELEAEIKLQLPENIPTVFISSVSGKGIQSLKDLIWNAINHANPY
ncbi:MAG: GTPase ObgE [Luteibaculaceae bacterium]